MSEDIKVQDGYVVAMDYTLKVDGEVVDTSDGREPLEYLHGAGNIIPGLERELTGMGIGESKDVVVAPAEGYGEMDDEAYVEVSRKEFPSNIPLEIGTQLQVSDQKGQPMFAVIDKVGDENVTLNFNHPLAGQELHFAVKVVSVRAATNEEQQHGHAHQPGHEH
jgi:FKBP-type peptidyl-prolyl cis-trans isomerase SlyD